jgi:hypothetical protein
MPSTPMLRIYCQEFERTEYKVISEDELMVIDLKINMLIHANYELISWKYCDNRKIVEVIVRFRQAYDGP